MGGQLRSTSVLTAGEHGGGVTPEMFLWGELMKIKDRQLKKLVDVSDGDCLRRKCYWPRPDPGVFTQGVGYRTRSGNKQEWLCGYREIRGCPSLKPDPLATPQKEKAVIELGNEDEAIL